MPGGLARIAFYAHARKREARNVAFEATAGPSPNFFFYDFRLRFLFFAFSEVHRYVVCSIGLPFFFFQTSAPLICAKSVAFNNERLKPSVIGRARAHPRADLAARAPDFVGSRRSTAGSARRTRRAGERRTRVGDGGKGRGLEASCFLEKHARRLEKVSESGDRRVGRGTRGEITLLIEATTVVASCPTAPCHL